MTTVKKGDVLRDNDPRQGGRTATVTRIVIPIEGAPYAIWESPTRENKIRLDRIFDDGKKRAQGWNLVTTTGVPYKVGDKVTDAKGVQYEAVKVIR